MQRQHNGLIIRTLYAIEVMSFSLPCIVNVSSKMTVHNVTLLYFQDSFGKPIQLFLVVRRNEVLVLVH